MNFSSPRENNPTSTFHLEEQLTDLTIHSETQFEYTETTKDVLFDSEEYAAGGYGYLDQPCSGESTIPDSDVGTSSHDFPVPEPGDLDSVVDFLNPEQVRWFYKCVTDKQWVEFSGYDSLRIEFKYRQLFYEWHENNASTNIESEGYIETDYSNSSMSHGSAFYTNESSPSENTNYNEQQHTSSDEHTIVVRGGMYEVDLKEWKCTSIYWPGEECAITRGIWFYSNWQPLEVEHSEVIETVHIDLFFGKRPSDFLQNPDDRAVRPTLFTQPFIEFHVDWYSPNETYLYSEAASSKLVRSLTQKLGFQKSTGYRLCRGYKNLATHSDRPVDITHLVFVIHGIGQKMDTGRIIKNTTAFRECVSWLKARYFPHSTQRAEFFPVEWRSSLKLDGDVVDSITPQKIIQLRQLLNSSAMDIMYYTSPLYGSEIQMGLAEELNKLYSMFTQRNPYFSENGGKVSVIAHSLGCVIIYDIVTGWRPACWQPTPDENSSGSSSLPTFGAGSSHSPASQPSLLFQIENLFCLGSPLSVFLALRWRTPHRDILPPTLCHRLYNIFHPSDPVAYRVEPLLEKKFSHIAPVQIQAYNANVHTAYEEMPLEQIVPDSFTQLQQTTSSKREGEESESPGNTPSKDRGWSIWGFMKWKASDEVDTSHLDSLASGLLYRIDYVLRETNFGGSYLTTLTSHTAYWNNYDVAYFILTRLFPELEEDSDNLKPSSTAQDSSK